MKKKITKALSVMLAVVLTLTAAPLSGFVGLKLPGWLDFSVEANAKTISDYQVGDIIEFGSYPQNKVTDETLISALDLIQKDWTSYRYYVDGEASDFMSYCDMVYKGNKYRAVYFTGYRPLETDKSSQLIGIQYYNGYQEGQIHYFVFEDLKWRVLNPSTGLIMCENIIDSQPYIRTDYTSTFQCIYDESNIREWLNSEFWQTAFNDYEQENVLITTYEQDNYVYNSTDLSYYTTSMHYTLSDKVFLLTRADMNNTNYGFNSSENRILIATDYSLCQGLGTDNNRIYSLRTSYKMSDTHEIYNGIVNFDGSLNYISDSSRTWSGVVPALSINPQSEIANPENPESDFTFEDSDYTQTHVVSEYSSEYNKYEAMYFDGFGTAMDGTDGNADLCVPGLTKADDMIPQGITYYPEKDWLLVSAYTKDKDKPSVIYAIDKSSGKYVAQFDVYKSNGDEYTGKLGGIAASDNNLYFTNNKSISYIPLSEFDVEPETVKSVTIAGAQSLSGQLGEASVSYVSFNKGVLYAGNFYNKTSEFNTPASSTHNSIIVGYVPSGSDSETEWNHFVSNVTSPVYTYKISNDIMEIQGATVKDGYLYLSSSYGRKSDSTLYVAEVGDNPYMCVDVSTADCYCSAPTMMEGITFAGEDLYAVFESGAYFYRDKSLTNKAERPTDVLWKADIPSLLEELEKSYLTLSGDYDATVTYNGSPIDVIFRQSWFSKDSAVYNHNLAQLCSQYVTFGYDIDGLENDLKAIGFTDVFWETEAKKQQVDNFIARRNITVGSETFTLLFVGCIGTNTVQWYSNFEPGTGETHASFNNAKNYVYENIGNYIDEYGIDTSKTKILLCGHSRGAATANLLGAELIDSEEFATKENIYTYTFATPNPTSSSKISDPKYARIFNFVNPEDFVTKVLPAQWEYGRYGTTYTLPSKTNTYAYELLKSKMQSYFGKLTEGEIYTPFKNGELETYIIVNKFTSTVNGIDDFYYKGMRGSITDNDMKPYEFFQNCICPLVGAEVGSEDFINGLVCFVDVLVDPTTCKTYKEFAQYFFVNAVLDKVNKMTPDLLKIVLPIIQPALTIVGVALSTSEGYFEDSHRAETYCAYLMSMISSQATAHRSGYKNTVNCPVDIEVYDKTTGELVGRITNNIVDEEIATQENSIVMSVDGDSKSFWLPSDGEYDVKLIGNDDGTMDYTVANVNSADSMEEQRVNFVNVDIKNDELSSGGFTGEEFVLEEYSLITEDDETIESDDIITKDNSDEFELDVVISIEGVGFATGDGIYTKGDYVTIYASTDENNEFLGWYENGKLVSTELEYGFVVQNDVEIVATFTENSENPCADGHDFYYGFCTRCGESDTIESSHPYDNDTDEIYLIYKEGASYIYVEFSEDTYVEDGYDFIEIYDKDDNLIGRYTGDELASENISVYGDTVKIRLISDSSNTEYGFKINDMSYMIIPNTDSSEKYDYGFHIQTPSRTTIRNKDTIVLHAVTDEELPEGYTIEWKNSPGNFSREYRNGDKTKMYATALTKGYDTITATLYDADGTVLATDSVTLYSKSGFFDKIGGFFRFIFGTTKTYEY